MTIEFFITYNSAIAKNNEISEGAAAQKTKNCAIRVIMVDSMVKMEGRVLKKFSYHFSTLIIKNSTSICWGICDNYFMYWNLKINISNYFELQQISNPNSFFDFKRFESFFYTRHSEKYLNSNV